MECPIRLCAGGNRREGLDGGLVEKSNFWSCVACGVVDRWHRFHLLVAAFVRQGSRTAEKLVDSRIGSPECIVARFLVKLDHGAIPVAVGDGNGIYLFGSDVPAIDSIDPQRVLIDRHGEDVDVTGADKVDADPLIGCVDFDDLMSTGTLLAYVERCGGQFGEVMCVISLRYRELSGNASESS